MIEMSDYVLDLLFRQKVISIPGLGTFRIVSSNSSIDFATNTLNPPNYEIRFGPADGRGARLYWRR